MDSIESIMDEIFSNYFIYKMQSSEAFGKTSIRHFNQSDYIFFGGTNALTSNINKEKYFGFSILNLVYFNRLLLLGVGWWQYQQKPNLYTKFFLKRMLDKSLLHSVRDSYTQNMLKSIGIKNVINTSCPSTWALDKQHCDQISRTKSDSVVFTITDYNKDPEADSSFINLIQNQYSSTFFWPQGSGDLEYFSKLAIPLRDKITVLKPNLDSFNSLIKNYKPDYIGTRLHAGIRSLQYKNRALIIGIDNRAIEMARDIKLDVTERGNLEEIAFFIDNNSPSLITIPNKEIEKWKHQFNVDGSKVK
tara:strand:- start:129 stop:1040 length:912 start_codon:yes stop_codon:yes gene_type:complete